MEVDHLEEACRFLRSAMHQDADVGRISRYDVERALEHIEEHRLRDRTQSANNRAVDE